jgi:hypothetical protein
MENTPQNYLAIYTSGNILSLYVMSETKRTISCYDKKRLSRKRTSKTTRNISMNVSRSNRSVVSSIVNTKLAASLDKLIVENPSHERLVRQQNMVISHLNRSYSPDANKYVVSFKESLHRMGNIDICNHNEFGTTFNTKNIGDIEIRIGDKKVKKCAPLKSKTVTDHMLSSLRNPRPLDINKVIFPIQIESNCWFNTWFVAMFISDKGKKFTRFLREKMITGRLSKKYGLHMKHTMKLLNLCIECSYNRGNYDTRYVINTNSIIRHLAESTVSEYRLGRVSPQILPGIYFQGDAGNPADYYRNLLYHLSTSADKFLMHTLEYEDDIVTNGKRVNGLMEADEIIVGQTIPDMVNIRTHTPNPERFRDIPVVVTGVYHFGETIRVVDRSGKRTNYELDSIIIRDIDKHHFIILFVCNNTSYVYDGELSTPVMKYNWRKEMLKDGKKLTIKYEDMKTSLTYKIDKSLCEYFYYRV